MLSLADKKFNRKLSEERIAEIKEMYDYAELMSRARVTAYIPNNVPDRYINEPMIYIHGVSQEFEPFGVGNNRDLELNKNSTVTYTLAIPEGKKLITTFTCTYENDQYVQPLHHIFDKQLVDRETFLKLEKSSNTFLKEKNKTLEKRQKNVDVLKMMVRSKDKEI